MAERVLLSELPRSMQERAVRARQLACSDPDIVSVDDQMLPWVWDPIDEVWYSFDGNYSSMSPEEKLEKARVRREKEEEWRHRALVQLSLDNGRCPWLPGKGAEYRKDTT